MVTVAGKKMGKSLENFLTLRDAFAKWPPMVIRLFILQSHYRSPTDFSEEALEAARSGYERVAGASAAIEKAAAGAPEGPADGKVGELVEGVRRRFAEAMDDDFNTPLALSALFDLARESNRLVAAGGLARGTVEALRGALAELGGGVLGLSFEATATGAADTQIAAGLVQILIQMRAEARKAKDFKGADAIRARLAEAGILLEDTPDGTTWRLK